MKVIKRDIQKAPLAAELGYSMTAGLLPERIREDGETGELTARIGSPYPHVENYYYLGVNGEQFNQHIDIDSTQFALVYDLGVVRPVEQIYISCYFKGLTNYTIGEFEFYAADSREALFNPENRVIYYDNRRRQKFHAPRNNADFLFDCEELSARFVAFRELNSNAIDGIARIRNICLYSKEFTHRRTYLTDNKLGGSCLSAGEDKTLSRLVDGIVFDDLETVTACNQTFSFELSHSKKIDHVIVISKGDCTFEVLTDSVPCAANITSESISDGRILYTADLIDNKESRQLHVKINGEATLDQILAYYDDRLVKVDCDRIITEDFLGIGADVIPCHLFESSRQLGYTEQYWQLEKRRISVAKPQLIRLWFQIDWFVMDEDGYLNRRYAFNSPKMQALYKELDAFLEADIEVEFNFGWKVGYTAQSWFSFPNVYNRKNSAPKNLDAFATACSDCLRELIVNRGYTNIKYLTFYNESNGGTPTGWDFTCPDGYDIKAYWLKMLKKCDAQLRADGLRSLVKIWVAESSNNEETMLEWPEYFHKNAPDNYDCTSFHYYRCTYEEAKARSQKILNATNNRPAFITEFGTYDYGIKDGVDFNFERTNQSSVLGFINGGLSGALFWILSGVYIDEHFMHVGYEASFWECPISNDYAGKVGNGTPRFYELSLLTNYIPRHSKVISTSCSDEGMHATAVKTPSGGYTVVVELRDSGKFDRQLTVDFGRDIGMTFRKHCYRLGCELEANMIIPPVEKELEVGSALCDTVDGKYALIVYTTESPKPQVVMESCEIFVKPGETVQLKARVIDGEGKLTWSMPDCHCSLGYPGSVTPDGLYTASDIHYAARVEGRIATDYAVKAQLPSGEYGIAIIKVRD